MSARETWDGARRRTLRGLAALLVAAALLPAASPGAAKAESPKAETPQAKTLAIRTHKGGVVPFTVTVARTQAELETGLMNRTSLAADAGMLFDFGFTQSVAMWMKDTLIPLDMLFIRADGTIAGIAARRVPESLDVIPSPGPVRAVLEINGGAAERLGIATGDRVEFPLFHAKAK